MAGKEQNGDGDDDAAPAEHGELSGSLLTVENHPRTLHSGAGRAERELLSLMALNGRIEAAPFAGAFLYEQSRRVVELRARLVLRDDASVGRTVASQIGIEAGSDGRFDDGPYLRVDVQVAYIARTAVLNVAAGAQVGHQLHTQQKDLLKVGH